MVAPSYSPRWIGRSALGAMFGLGLWTLHAPAIAQITPDDTLGAEGSVLTEDILVRGGLADLIEGGAIRDTNLFHSFLEFNIDEGQRVYFANPAAIANIFSRVTGSDPSDILGTLGVDGPANLFFLNPNGIIFGPNSSLNVQGSFAAITAGAIQFGDRGFFSASNPEAPSELLTVNPSAFFFNQIPAGNIVNQSVGFGAGLQVPNGENLLLLGGNVTIDGGRLSAFGGRVNVGAVGGIGLVELDLEGGLSFPAILERANVTFTNGALVDVALDDRGDIVATGQNIILSERSILAAGIRLGLGDNNSQAGDIILDALDIVRITNES